MPTLQKTWSVSNWAQRTCPRPRRGTLVVTSIEATRWCVQAGNRETGQGGQRSIGSCAISSDGHSRYHGFRKDLASDHPDDTGLKATDMRRNPMVA
jgi:hypothetical protein